jgi:hypothetical protein
MTTFRWAIKWYLVSTIVCFGLVVAQDKLIPPRNKMEMKSAPSQVVDNTKLRTIDGFKESPWDPPEEYVFFSSRYILDVKNVSDTNVVCRAAAANLAKVTPRMRINACSLMNVDYSGNVIRCTIIVPFNDGTLPEKRWKGLFNHELAHCNGWKHP